jgi:hypothetical protein
VAVAGAYRDRPRAADGGCPRAEGLLKFKGITEKATLMEMTTPIRERLAALEHEQWAHWTRYLLDHPTPENIERWRWQIDTPYDRLNESEKQSDREWADRVREVVGKSTPPEGRDRG